MYLSNLNTMSRDPYWWSSSANEAPKEERWPGGLLATLEEPTKYRNQLEDALRVINTDDDSYRFDERDGFDERGGLISRVESGRDKWQAKITIRHQPETAIIIDETLPQGQIKYSLNVDLSSYQKSIYNLKIVFNKLEEILAFPEAAEMPHEKSPNFIDQSVLYSTRPKIIIEQHPEIFFQPNPESGYRLRTTKSSLVPYHVRQRNEETVLLRPPSTYRESMLDPNNHPKACRVLIDGYILKEWIIHMKKNKGITGIKIAKILGLNHGTVNRWVSGARLPGITPLTTEQIKRLEKLANQTFKDWILELSDDNKIKQDCMKQYPSYFL